MGRSSSLSTINPTLSNFPQNPQFYDSCSGQMSSSLTLVISLQSLTSKAQKSFPLPPGYRVAPPTPPPAGPVCCSLSTQPLSTYFLLEPHPFSVLWAFFPVNWWVSLVCQLFPSLNPLTQYLHPHLRWRPSANTNLNPLASEGVFTQNYRTYFSFWVKVPTTSKRRCG